MRVLGLYFRGTKYDVMFVVDLCFLRVLNTTDKEKYCLYPDTKAASGDKRFFLFLLAVSLL